VNIATKAPLFSRDSLNFLLNKISDLSRTSAASFNQFVYLCFVDFTDELGTFITEARVRTTALSS